MKFIVNHIDELQNIAEEIKSKYPEQRIFAFYGPMGAGKTTFIKAFCRSLNVTDIVCSPTFAIVNEYKTKQNELVYHFDFYRIKDIKEVFDIGYEDYFYSGNYCFLEWTEKIEELLPEKFVKIAIIPEETHREIEITA